MTKETKNKGGAPAGNTNRQKGEEPRTATISMRCAPSLRSRILQSVEGRKEKDMRGGISDWLAEAAESKLAEEDAQK